MGPMNSDRRMETDPSAAAMRAGPGRRVGEAVALVALAAAAYLSARLLGLLGLRD